GVVAVGLGAAVGGGADVAASALGAADQPGEGVLGGVRGAVADLGRPGAEDALGEVELPGADEGFVGVGDDDVAEAFLTDIDPVGQDQFDGVRRPRLAHPGGQAVVVEPGGDGLGTEPIFGVPVEDHADGAGLGRFGDEFVAGAVDQVAQRAGAAG